MVRHAAALLTICLAAVSCRSYHSAPLALRVTSEPSGAVAELACPQMPEFEPRRETTPATFHLPIYTSPCKVTVSKEGWSTEERALDRDVLRPRGGIRECMTIDIPDSRVHRHI